MVVTLEAWLQSLKALLPPGRAFTREPGSVLEKLLSGVAAQLLASQLKVEGLLLEADPRQATTMLADWELLLDLPDDCAAMQTQQLAPGKYDYQLEALVTFARASTATYINAGVRVTAAANVPRYENNVLLLEPASENLWTYSETPSNAVWSKSGCTVVDNAATGADGNLSLSKLVESAVNQQHRTFRNFVVESGKTYSYSFDLRAGERTAAYVLTSTGSTVVARTLVVIDLITGVYTVNNPDKARVVGLSNGVWRVTITETATGTTLQPNVYVLDPSNALSYLGDGVSGLYIGAAMLEVGAVGSSHVPTVAATVPRAADIATVRLPQSTFDRQLGAFQRLIEQGGQSIPYFIGIASALGEMGVTITELRPLTCNDDCNDALNTPADSYTWQVSIPRAAANNRLFNCNSNCNASLEDFTPSLIECAFNERKPAHTNITFIYAA